MGIFLSSRLLRLLGRYVLVGVDSHVCLLPSPEGYVHGSLVCSGSNLSIYFCLVFH